MNEQSDWISDVQHRAQELVQEFRERARSLPSKWEVEKHIGYCEGFVDAIPKYLAVPNAGITHHHVEFSSATSPSRLNRLLGAFFLTVQTFDAVAYLRLPEKQSARKWRFEKLFEETDNLSYGDVSLYEIPERDFADWQTLLVTHDGPLEDLGIKELVLLARRLANVFDIPSDWLQQLTADEEDDALCKMLEVKSRMTEQSHRHLDYYFDELRSMIRERCKEAVRETKALAGSVHRPEDRELVLLTAELSQEWVTTVLLDKSLPGPSILERLANLTGSDVRKMFGLLFSAHVCVLAAADHEDRHATRLSELGHLVFGLRRELCRSYVNIGRNISAGKEAPNFLEVGRSEFRGILGIQENSDADAMLHSLWFDLDNNVREALLSQSRHFDDLDSRARAGCGVQAGSFAALAVSLLVWRFLV